MATATLQHLPSNGSLNGNGIGNGRAKKYVAHRAAEDDDSISTEQFPEFDPSHDGSEDEVNADGGGHYTHTTAERRNGAHVSRVAVNGDGAEAHDEGQSGLHHDDDDAEAEEHRLSPVEPLPELDHPHYDHEQETGTTTPTTTYPITSPITSPPYWRHSYANANGNGASHPHGNINLSTESLVPGGITLQDNEADDDGGGGGAHNDPRQRDSEETRTSYGRDRNKACWARSVEVTDYVTVNGSATNIGAFVVWNIRVQTLSGPYMNIRKRYSEFDDFRHALVRTFPGFEAAVPVLPPKSVISRFRPRFLEKRRAGLQYFLNCILLNPEFSGSPVLKDFLFS